MADKATRERLKRMAAEQHAAKEATEESSVATLGPPAEKKPVTRKCCQSIKGQAPHEPTCKHHPDFVQPAKPKKPKQRFNPDDFRLPDGTVITASYDATAKAWLLEMVATIEGETREFTRVGTNYDKIVHQAAGECRAWARAKKQPAASGPV